MSDFDYGILAELMKNEAIESIFINDPEHIFVQHEQDGYQAIPLSFPDAAHLANFARSLANAMGHQLDASNPIAELRLADGSRATLIVSPVATQGAVIRISKPSKNRLTLPRLVELGTISENAARFLRAAVKSRLNIAVVGGFDSGKVTFLNALVDEIPESARLLVIQPISALSIQHTDAVILESRKADLNGAGAVKNRQLLEQTVQLVPHRLILAEVDGTEADVLLNTMDLTYSTMFAMNASGARDALSRLESQVAGANLSKPLLSIREQLARTVDLIVHIELFELGEIALKRVMGISELRGMKGDSIELESLFERPRDRDSLLASGEIPQVLGKIQERGRAEVDESWFMA